MTDRKHISFSFPLTPHHPYLSLMGRGLNAASSLLGCGWIGFHRSADHMHQLISMVAGGGRERDRWWGSMRRLQRDWLEVVNVLRTYTQQTSLSLPPHGSIELVLDLLHCVGEDTSAGAFISLLEDVSSPSLIFFSGQREREFCCYC
jgi:hypothetical protein